uniref:Putative structural protein n=1 Tax=Picornavirales N_OV_137 TaxID=2016025 RepID=A0A218NJS6_9VIRU|nr:putative structural protein [Picornavirales N_OV_137]
MIDSVAVSTEGSMTAHTHKGQELGSFLSRPVKISEFVWNGSTTTVTDVDPWSLFLEHPSVARKIANFKLLRGDLHMKIVINGSPFLFGRLMAYYNPLPGVDDFLPENNASNLTRISQRMHVKINPSTSSGAEMTLPFFWPYNALHIPTKEWQKLGRVSFLPISELQSTSGTQSQISVSVFAWMNKVELSQPTSYSGMSEEKEQKIVSKTAMAIGNVADAISDVPLIGPYATATGIVAKKLGRMADLFGFSKPLNTYDLVEERTRHLGSTATINDKDSSKQLTLDVHNETTIDPRTVGLSPIDEMSIPYLCQKEAIICRCKWNINDPVGKTLMRIPVTPFIKGSLNTDDAIQVPPCAYVASFFKYWRGTLKYRFEIHGSAFHRGKLRIKYEPWSTSDPDDYNVVSSDIVDLTTTQDYAINVGWGSHRNNLITHGIFPDYDSASTIASSFYDRHNGLVALQVENPLTVPDDDGAIEVDIVISVATEADIQFHVPENTTMETYAITNDQGTNVIPTPPPPPEGVFPQPVKAYSDTRIGAYYYGWHSGGFNGGTNSNNYLRKLLVDDNGTSVAHTPWVKPRPPEEYDDRQRDVTRKQFDLMCNAGIDFIVCSWWGKDSRTDIHFRDYVMTETGNVAGNHMRACIHYETMDLKRNGNWTWNSDVATQAAEDFRRMYDYILDDQKYLHKDGKPVIFFYLYRSMPSSFRNALCLVLNDIWQNEFATSKTPYIAADVMFGNAQTIPTNDAGWINAMTTYDVYGQTSKGRSVIEEADVAAYHKEINNWANANPSLDVITCVSPGYNDRGVRLQEDHVGLARYLKNWDHGSLFKAHFKHFNLETKPTGTHWIVINSWNEWQEDSIIEPVSGGATTDKPTNITSGNTYESYGTKYVNIVGEYMVPSYVGQSSDEEVHLAYSGMSEETNENAKEMQVSSTMVEKPWTYSQDDAIFFGERNGSLRGPLKRYSVVYKYNTTDSGKNILYLPLYPHQPQTPISGLTTYDHLMNWVEVLYHGKRGSTRWKVLNDFKNSTARIASVRLEKYSALDIKTNISSNDVLKNGWQGMELVTGVYNPVLEWACPRYSDLRFDNARKLGPVTEMRGHSHSYDTAAVNKNYYLCAGGDDLQYFYFAGTPSLRFR